MAFQEQLLSVKVKIYDKKGEITSYPKAGTNLLDGLEVNGNAKAGAVYLQTD
ncbi:MULTISPECIES: hypothetical protein [unclassified Enterococcus]|uniref:hypothetical protein n=1 Tax=unclassified Enterococcus TaxID=2608891 RepID=UPI0015573537|nr:MULTISPECIES: hypothetical protein [unclassified Enterococcus]MBS7577834.1 hypothetical protein [Enterococcus sp. MMGLQ5-2]MBS7585094.1 hypothetical protein [Enterococcus sp. MMGLQ5-1]NPD12950.1 hypothetical protein [Enterococcus sp. MMGLQ5-1]NPD37664.1 hypothetical protein [Enterococcus sp. MMGLQ5-2]